MIEETAYDCTYAYSLSKSLDWLVPGVDAQRTYASVADVAHRKHPEQKVAARVGICFHVGSQTMTPRPYRDALRLVKKLLKAGKVSIDSLNVGGGYPVAYPGLKPKPMHNYWVRVWQTDSDQQCPI